MDAVKAPPWVWGAVVLIALGSVGGSFKAVHDQHSEASRLKLIVAQAVKNQACLTSFIAENSRVSKLRSAATAERDAANSIHDAAISQLLSGVADLSLDASVTPSQNAAGYHALLKRYKQTATKYQVAADKLQKERAKNPLPDLPASCSDLPTVSQH